MDLAALRDHASAMLDEFARAMEQPQTGAKQERKAWGDAPEDGGEATAAEEHGVDRARRGFSVWDRSIHVLRPRRPCAQGIFVEQARVRCVWLRVDRARRGFSLDETFAEYRALRASVMQYWTRAGIGSAPSEVDDLIRFKEAIDQAIAESIHEYSKAVRRYRDMFLAVLGHDLRSPLDAVLNASAFLAENARLSASEHRLVAAIGGSGIRMRDLIEDMLDYTTAELGAGMPLRRSGADMGEVAEEVVRQSEMTHPGREFRAELRGDLTGQWDERRIRQALLNLIDNAVQHGSPDSAITVSACGQEASGDVIVSVHNLGTPISEEARARILAVSAG